jgi:hypothetical protein
MALVVKDRVQETSTTTGTGTLTLSGAASGYQSFSSAIGNGNTTYYAISNGTDWEVGVGTVGSGTLSRDTVLESSNAGSLVDFIAGVKTVFCTYPAERSVNTEDIGVSIQAYDADTAKYDDTTANFTGTLQNGGSNVLVDTDIGSTVEAYDSTILKSASIGVTVQAYDADTAKYDDATANFTGTLQNGGSNVVVDTDIGSTVQAYDADTAKYDDATANFTGTLQNGGSNVVVDTDIGSTVQAYDSNLTSFVGTFTLPTTDGTANQVMKTDGSGNIGFTTITAGDAYVGSTNTFTANQIISVTDNTNAALRITQAGTGDALLVEDEANPDSTPFVVKNDGKVGIGVSTPSYPLDITLLEATSRIYSTQAGKGAMRLATTTTGTLHVGKDYEGSSGWFGNGGEYIIAGTGNYPMDFYTNTTKRFSIKADGKAVFGASQQTGFVSTVEGLQLVGTAGPNSSYAQYRFTNDSGGANCRLYKSRGTSAGSFAAVQLNDVLGHFGTYGTDGINWYGTAAIETLVDGTVSTGIVPSRMEFKTSNTAGSIDVVGVFKTNGDFQFNSGYGSSATAYGCRAWVNFNGTGTVAIRASGNVSSITDNGTGNYTVNFTTAMPDANYSAVALAKNDGNADVEAAAAYTTTTFRFQITRFNVGGVDASFCNVSVFR